MMEKGDGKTFKFGRYEYQVVDKISLKRYSQLAELMSGAVDEKGLPTINKLFEFTRNWKNIDRFMKLMLVPTSKFTWIRRIYDMIMGRSQWAGIYDANIDDLIGVMNHFFSFNGPLHKSFQNVLGSVDSKA